ncbi:hypothetical protein H8356DRAFT_1344251 [Neocallimastix lanati (nom. inval.)]|nr:hypothetical protein H8356DRAFT_1344251 [Neocallimastix sp. JGI-2020a]
MTKKDTILAVGLKGTNLYRLGYIRSTPRKYTSKILRNNDRHGSSSRDNHASMEVCNYLIIPTTPERGVGLNPKVVHRFVTSSLGKFIVSISTQTNEIIYQNANNFPLKYNIYKGKYLILILTTIFLKKPRVKKTRKMVIRLDQTRSIIYASPRTNNQDRT